MRRAAPGDAAERLLRRSLEIRQRTLTSAHPDIAMTAYALAEADLRQGRLPQALKLARDAARLLRTRLSRKQDLARVAIAAFSDQGNGKMQGEAKPMTAAGRSRGMKNRPA